MFFSSQSAFQLHFIFIVCLLLLICDGYIFFQLKPEFGMNFCLFGGLEGLDKFMRVHTAPSCSEEVSM